jgi:hypothetical protein
MSLQRGVLRSSCRVAPVTTVLVVLGGLVVAVAVAWRLPQRHRALLAVPVLVLPVALTLVDTVHHEKSAIDRYFGLTPVEAEVDPPLRWRAYENVELLRAMRRLVPADATISFLPGGRWTETRTPDMARSNYLQTGWVRWVAFVTAPRIVVPGADADWTVLVDQSPSEAGIRFRRAWRFGNDWLVQR